MIVPNSDGYPLRSFRGLGAPLLLTVFLANAARHAIAVCCPVDFFRLSLPLTVSRQDADTRADGYASSSPTGRGCTEKSTE